MKIGILGTGHIGKTLVRELSAAGHDVSVMSRSTRVRTPDEKLEGFRIRAKRAVAMQGN